MTYSTQSNIPIDLLPGIGRRTAKVLHKLEIKTVGQFKQMPERVLVELFGPSIKNIYWQVTDSSNKIKNTSSKKRKKSILLKIKNSIISKQSDKHKFHLINQLVKSEKL